MNLAPLSVPAIVCAATMSGSVVAEPITAVRGLAARVEIEYAHRLRAREDQTPNSPILVRVSSARSADGTRQVIEFIGAGASLESGTADGSGKVHPIRTDFTTGDTVRVWCNSNCDRVELFLNGRSLGAKSMTVNSHLEWAVPYARGVLEALTRPS